MNFSNSKKCSITTGDASNNKRDWNEIRFEYKRGQDKIHENGTKTRKYRQTTNIKLDEYTFERVTNFKYLGVIVNNKADIKHEVTEY